MGGERLENPLEIMLVLHPYFMQVTTLLSIWLQLSHDSIEIAEKFSYGFFKLN